MGMTPCLQPYYPRFVPTRLRVLRAFLNDVAKRASRVSTHVQFGMLLAYSGSWPQSSLVCPDSGFGRRAEHFPPRRDYILVASGGGSVRFRSAFVPFSRNSVSQELSGLLVGRAVLDRERTASVSFTLQISPIRF